MFDHFRTLTRGALTAAIVFAAPTARAQTAAALTETDPRWTSWLGCWAVDGSREDQRSSSAGVTCFVPVAGSRAVDALTIARGSVLSRDRLESGGRPHPIDGNGCRGNETMNWSSSGRRAYLHAEYACSGGTPGNSTSLYAISSRGEWLKIEKVRSGGGSIVQSIRLRPVALSSALSVNTAREIDAQQRAITLARAAAAVPISADEVVDAINNLDGDVVRSWLVESDQVFDFDVSQLVTLSNAGVPVPILQLLGGRTLQVAPLVSAGPTIVYQPAPTYVEAAPVMTTMRQCPPDGCYATNPYSAYNGGSTPNAGFPYPYPYPQYGLSPFGFSPFSTFAVATQPGNRRNFNDGRNNHPRQPNRPNHPKGRGPTGGGRWSGPPARGR